MDIYLFCMLLGFVGLMAMAFSGLGHHGAGGHAAGGHAHGGHLPGGAAHGAGHGHALPGAGHSTTHVAHGAHPHGAHPTAPARSEAQRDAAPSPGSSALSGALLGWVSPRTLFSVLLGFGAIGTLIHVAVHEPEAMLLAAVGGLVFEGLLMKPIWNLLLSFASKPARTLEDTIAEEARAVSNFDASGCGLIALEMDGQTRQVLGTLRPADREAGVRVRTGDALFVESVDTKRNSCVVSTIGSHHVEV